MLWLVKKMIIPIVHWRKSQHFQCCRDICITCRYTVFMAFWRIFLPQQHSCKTICTNILDHSLKKMLNDVQRKYIPCGWIILAPLDNLWGYFKASPRMPTLLQMLLLTLCSFHLFLLKLYPIHTRLNMKLLNKIFCQNLTASCSNQNIDRKFEFWNETYLAGVKGP